MHIVYVSSKAPRSWRGVILAVCGAAGVLLAAAVIHSGGSTTAVSDASEKMRQEVPATTLPIQAGPRSVA